MISDSQLLYFKQQFAYLTPKKTSIIIVMIQQILVFLIIALSVGYIVYRINKTMREAKSGCYGCKGCALREQMIKNGKYNRHKGGVGSSPKCSNFKKKDD